MTTHTRDSLALAHHRFYCQGHDLEFCEANDTDRDFADFAMQQLAETAPPIFVHSEAFVVPLEDPADRDGGEGDAALLGLVSPTNDGQQVLGTCSPEPPSGAAS